MNQAKLCRQRLLQQRGPFLPSKGLLRQLRLREADEPPVAWTKEDMKVLGVFFSACIFVCLLGVTLDWLFDSSGSGDGSRWTGPVYGYVAPYDDMVIG